MVNKLNKNEVVYREIFYNNDLEQLLAQSAEECESLGILHLASYEKYNKLSNIINIPVIVLSSGIGFITGIDLNYDKMNIILGIGSVFVGIIKSIDSYFQLGKRAESHRMCALQYTQINKKIQIELSLCREQRQTAKDMLSIIKTDIKNLQDISPVIDQEIIKEYNLKYGKYKNVKKPNFVNGLSSVKINMNSLEEEMAFDSSRSIKSDANSRPLSENGDSGQRQNKEVIIDIPLQHSQLDSQPRSPSFYPYQKTPNYKTTSNQSTPTSSASAQLVYANANMNTIANANNSIIQMPVSSSPSPISSFRIDGGDNVAAHLSTPQLLTSFQETQIQLNSQKQQQDSENQNNINLNLIIDNPNDSAQLM